MSTAKHTPGLPKHPFFDTAEYWLKRARDERAFAAHKRASRFGTVESIRIHEQNADEYEQRAAAIAKAEGR